jgi:hypothetical protein
MVITKDTVNTYRNIHNMKILTAEDFLHFTANVNTSQF